MSKSTLGMNLATLFLNKDEVLQAEKILHIDGQGNSGPMYPQKNKWSVTDPHVCELYGDDDELLATFGREGVTVYNPTMEVGKGNNLYLYNTHGQPTLRQWDGFKVMAKALFDYDFIDRDCPNFLQHALVERETAHIEE
jgi:hypothetical protein